MLNLKLLIKKFKEYKEPKSFNVGKNNIEMGKITYLSFNNKLFVEGNIVHIQLKDNDSLIGKILEIDFEDYELLMDTSERFDRDSRRVSFSNISDINDYYIDCKEDYPFESISKGL